MALSDLPDLQIVTRPGNTGVGTLQEFCVLCYEIDVQLKDDDCVVVVVVACMIETIIKKVLLFSQKRLP